MTHDIQPHAPLKALFCTAVWGEEFVSRFLKYSLRTQITPGNIGVFDASSLFLIITDRNGRDLILASPTYRELAETVSVECLTIDAISNISMARQKYSILTACQNYALSRSANFDVIFFGYADAVWAEGSYRAAMQRIHDGYDAVFTVGYPTVDIPIHHLIDRAESSSPQGAVAISPRMLAQHVYEHLHPMSRSNIWTNASMGGTPSYLMWDVPGQGMLTRAFHLHPVVVRVSKDALFFVPFRTTLDEEFVARLSRTNHRLYVSGSSDELCVCGPAADDGHNYFAEPRRLPNVSDLANFAEGHAGLAHRELFTHNIRLVIDDVSDKEWQPSEAASAAVSREIDRRLSTPDSVLDLEAPDAYAARKRRQNTYRHWQEIELAAWSLDIETSESLFLLLKRRFISRGFALMHRLYVARAVRRLIPVFFGKEYGERVTEAVQRHLKQNPWPGPRPGLIAITRYGLLRWFKGWRW